MLIFLISQAFDARVRYSGQVKTPFVLFALAAVASVGATTKGLNQIVTPDVQPYGQFSLSFQAQNQALGNPLQIQYELGITHQLEVAAFQGLQPSTAYFATEYGIIQQKNLQVACGVVNFAAQGAPVQPFVEAGVLKGNGRFIAGIQRIGRANDLILGGNYQLNSRVILMSDYLGGSQNFFTVGATYVATPTVSVNPALYVSNAPGHKVFPYIVLSWNLTAFK